MLFTSNKFDTLNLISWGYFFMEIFYPREELIKELKADIAEFGDEFVWGYKAPVNDKVFYVDYYFDETNQNQDYNDIIRDGEYPPVTIRQFDESIARDYKMWSREKLLASDLLKKLIAQSGLK